MKLDKNSKKSQKEDYVIDHFHDDVTRLWGRIKARLLMFQLDSVNRNLCVRSKTFSKKADFSLAGLKKINGTDDTAYYLMNMRKNEIIW